jgi:hypothetical protein
MYKNSHHQNTIPSKLSSYTDILHLNMLKKFAKWVLYILVTKLESINIWINDDMQITFNIHFNFIPIKHYMKCFTNCIVDNTLLSKSFPFITYLPTQQELAKNVMLSQAKAVMRGMSWSHMTWTADTQLLINSHTIKIQVATCTSSAARQKIRKCIAISYIRMN